MNLNEQQIENTLRNAPRPAPAAGLKKQLIAQIRLPGDAAAPARVAATLGFSGWLRRWWPALAPAGLSLACGVVMAVQRAEMRDLKSSIQNAAVAAPAITQNATRTKAPDDSVAISTEEVTRLQERVSQLSGEISQLEQQRVENETLKKQLAASTTANSQEMAEFEAATKARERALRIQCVNNLKQLGLALRTYELDNTAFPPDLSSMSNEVNSLKILICPADTNRPIAASWSTVTAANCSYDYLAVSANATEPNRIAMRCQIHGNFLCCDGSVQSLSHEKQAALLEHRDGKLYMGNNMVPTVRPPAKQ
jgi:hypothetical protein